ncbi:recombinase family protein [Klebsiella pneumoniae]|uniref:recombinase family protein n=1 Tax=Klebsiella quasipneumoniae TaxID=1463165 RepID=UPI0039EF0B37
MYDLIFFCHHSALGMQSNAADSFTSLSKRSTLSRGAFSPATVPIDVLSKPYRLGRSVRDLITLVSELQARGVNFRSLTDSIDTSTAAGRFFFHVMSALAEMERELIVERTRAGLAAAREQGRVGGRRRIMTEEVVERCRRMLENGATRQQVADVIGVDVKTIYKYLPAT